MRDKSRLGGGGGGRLRAFLGFHPNRKLNAEFRFVKFDIWRLFSNFKDDHKCKYIQNHKLAV